MTLEDFKGFVGTQYGLQDTGISLSVKQSVISSNLATEELRCRYPLLAHPETPRLRRQASADAVLMNTPSFKASWRLRMRLFESSICSVPPGATTRLPQSKERHRSKTTPSESKTSRPNATKQDSAQDLLVHLSPTASHQRGASRTRALDAALQPNRSTNQRHATGKGISSDVSLTKEVRFLARVLPRGKYRVHREHRAFPPRYPSGSGLEFGRNQQLEEERERIQRSWTTQHPAQELSVAPTATQADIPCLQ